mgnify:CR=1 FL=1
MRRNQTLKIRPCKASLWVFASKLRGLVPGKEGCSQDLATSQGQGGGLLVPEQEDLMAGVWFLTLSRHQEACWRLYLLLWLTGLKCQQIQWTNLLKEMPVALKTGSLYTLCGRNKI